MTRVVVGYSIGPQWEVADGGRRAVNTKDPDKVVFHRNSQAGVLIERMCKVITGGDWDAFEAFMSPRGKMTETKSYVGLSFRWTREEVTTPSGGKTLTWLPTKYLGDFGGAGISHPLESELQDRVADKGKP